MSQRKKATQRQRISLLRGRGMLVERQERNAALAEQAGAHAMGENYEPRLRFHFNPGPRRPLPVAPVPLPCGVSVLQHSRHVVALSGPNLGRELWANPRAYLGLFSTTGE